jgi:hypothetical protein
LQTGKADRDSSEHSSSPDRIETGHQGGAAAQARDHAPSWPIVNGGDRVVFLLDVASRYEERLLRQWIEQARPADLAAERIQVLTIPSSRTGRGKVDPGLEPVLATGENPTLAPLRVAWLPAERGGQRTARLSVF